MLSAKSEVQRDLLDRFLFDEAGRKVTPQAFQESTFEAYKKFHILVHPESTSQGSSTDLSNDVLPKKLSSLNIAGDAQAHHLESRTRPSSPLIHSYSESSNIHNTDSLIEASTHHHEASSSTRPGTSKQPDIFDAFDASTTAHDPDIIPPESAQLHQEDLVQDYEAACAVAAILKIPKPEIHDYSSIYSILGIIYESYCFLRDAKRFYRESDIAYHMNTVKDESVLISEFERWIESLSRKKDLNVEEHIDYIAWRTLIGGVRNKTMHNCFLDKTEGVSRVCIDSTMAKMAGFKWISGSEHIWLVWQRFSRRAVLEKGSSILHAYGPLYEISENIAKEAAPLPEIWSIGLDCAFYAVPTAEDYAYYFSKEQDSMNLDLKEIGKHSRNFRQLLSRLMEMQRRKKMFRSAEAKNGYKKAKLEIHNKKRCWIRLGAKQPEATVSGDSTFVVRTIIRLCAKKGLVKEEQHFDVRKDISLALNHGPGATHEIKQRQRRCDEIWSDRTPRRKLKMELTRDDTLKKSLVVLMDLSLEQDSFITTYILTALAQLLEKERVNLYGMELSILDQTNHGERRRSQGNNVIYFSGPFNLSEVVASGCQIYTRYLKKWNGRDVFIDEHGRIHNADVNNGRIPISEDRKLLSPWSYERRKYLTPLFADFAQAECEQHSTEQGRQFMENIVQRAKYLLRNENNDEYFNDLPSFPTIQ